MCSPVQYPVRGGIRPPLLPPEAPVKPTRTHARMTENLPGSNYDADETEFLKAMERFQRKYRRRYPTWTEVLLVVRCLGYRRVAAPVPVPPPKSRPPTFPPADDLPNPKGADPCGTPSAPS